jgi:hypothetical protein
MLQQEIGMTHLLLRDMAAEPSRRCVGMADVRKESTHRKFMLLLLLM